MGLILSKLICMNTRFLQNPTQKLPLLLTPKQKQFKMVIDKKPHHISAMQNIE